MTHEITVNYFNTDDGIWLVCKCGWEFNVGYTPSYSMLAKAVEEHVQSKKLTHYRSSQTGAYVSEEFAKANPAITVRETD